MKSSLFIGQRRIAYAYLVSHRNCCRNTVVFVRKQMDNHQASDEIRLKECAVNTEEIERIGEVIESATSCFTAQCYELDRFPALGALVKTQNSTRQIYGIVFNASTEGIDPGRKPLARGKDASSEEALYEANPQIAKLLKSEFEALVVGYKEDDRVFHYLPPQPAPIHSFVYLCPARDVTEFSRSFEFLNTILNSSVTLPHEELIAATLRRMGLVQEDKHAFLVAAGKHLASTLSGDFNRLRTILERIRE